MAGRKLKLTPETQQLLVQAISLGATQRLACQYAGIDADTYCRWINRGKAGERPFADFAEAIKKAEGRGALGWLAKIEAAANEGTWQAAAWKLERLYPQEYGRQIVEQQHTGKDGGPLVMTVRVSLAPDVAQPVEIATGQPRLLENGTHAHD